MTKMLVSLVAPLMSCLSHAQPPGLILTNGRIFTSDTSQLYIEALDIKGGRITATGISINDVKKW